MSALLAPVTMMAGLSKHWAMNPPSFFSTLILIGSTRRCTEAAIYPLRRGSDPAADGRGGGADVAYRDAKELAVSVEDAVAVHDGLDCVAIIRPPSDKKTHSEFYVPAKGHLEDKNCSVVDESGIRGSLIRIRKKISA